MNFGSNDEQDKALFDAIQSNFEANKQKLLRDIADASQWKSIIQSGIILAAIISVVLVWIKFD